MTVEVLDRNQAIGILETLRGFDSVQSVSLEKLEEKEDRLSEEEINALGDDVVIHDLDADEEDEEAEEEAEEAEEAKDADADEEAADEETEEGKTVYTVNHIGTYYTGVDAKTGEKYICRRYVAFTVTCVYVPQEQVVVESNVNVPEEAAQ